MYALGIEKAHGWQELRHHNKFRLPRQLERPIKFAERFNQFSLRIGITSEGDAKLFRMKVADFSLYLVDFR